VGGGVGVGVGVGVGEELLAELEEELEEALVVLEEEALAELFEPSQPDSCDATNSNATA